MDETINKETVAGEPGAVETPTQPPSETRAAPSAVDEASLKAILEPLVQAEVERRTQSVKDKRIAKQESRISSIEDTLTQLRTLQAEGMSERQAIQYVKMEEFLASQGIEAPTDVPPEQELAVQAKVAGEDYLSPILKDVGLDANDPDVIAVLRRESDPSKRLIAFGTLAETRKQAQQLPPNPAAALPSGGGQAVETETLESVTAELNALQLKPATPATRARIQELGKKHKVLLPKQ